MVDEGDIIKAVAEERGEGQAKGRGRRIGFGLIRAVRTRRRSRSVRGIWLGMGQHVRRRWRLMVMPDRVIRRLRVKLRRRSERLIKPVFLIVEL